MSSTLPMPESLMGSIMEYITAIGTGLRICLGGVRMPDLRDHYLRYYLEDSELFVDLLVVLKLGNKEGQSGVKNRECLVVTT